jgi:hypothetical protein
MKFIVLLMTSILVGQSAFALTNLTISCDVELLGERTDETTTPSITFDADKGYRDLVLDVYGSDVTVSANLYMNPDGKTCGHDLSICTATASGEFCSGKPEATVYPSNGQVGDLTLIRCELKGGEPAPCRN